MKPAVHHYKPVRKKYPSDFSSVDAFREAEAAGEVLPGCWKLRGASPPA